MIAVLLNYKKLKMIKTGELINTRTQKYGYHNEVFVTCKDCKTDFIANIFGTATCNGKEIMLCPWCRPDTKKWQNGRGE